MKLLLWDIDGTLLRIGFSGNILLTRLGQQLFGPDFGPGNLPLAGQLDLVLFRHALANAGIPFDISHWNSFQSAFSSLMQRELEAQAHRMRLMPNAREIVEHLHDRADIQQGLVTGNLRANAIAKIRAAQFNPQWFGPSAFGCEREARHQLIDLAIDRYHETGRDGLTRRDVIVIGDTPLDVQAAQNAGVRCLAVATGEYSVQQLIDVGADRAVNDLTDPSALLELLD